MFLCWSILAHGTGGNTRKNGHLLFDVLGDLPDHSEKALLMAGHTDGNTVFS